MSRLIDKIPFPVKMGLLNLYNSLNRYKIYLYRNGYPKKNQNSIPLKLFEQYNKFRALGPRKRFCYVPFTNLFFNTYGSAILCCYNTRVVLGKYPQKNLHELWFSSEREMLCNHLLVNDLSLGCDYCRYQIEMGRFEKLKPSTVDRYATTNFARYPRLVEFELTNTCNLECVMCSGRVSSTIRKNRENAQPLPNPYNDEFVTQLEEFIPHMKQANFYGGEPFLIDIYYKIWDKMMKMNPRCNLYILTNATIYNDKVERVLQNLNLSIGVSIDAMDKQLYEKIRKNANYETVIKNIYRFADYCNNKGKALGFSITPMILNWKEIPEIVRFANSLQANVYFSFVEKPEKLALWSLSREQLINIADYYRSVNLPEKTAREKINKRCFEEITKQIEFWLASGEKPSSSFFPDPHETNSGNSFQIKECSSIKEAFEFLNMGLLHFFTEKNADPIIAENESEKIFSKIYEVIEMENDKDKKLHLLNKIIAIGITEAFIDEIKNNNSSTLADKASYFLMTD
jgi:sulfatase maturation enzyme AslB (radical SAM superfamily)